MRVAIGSSTTLAIGRRRGEGYSGDHSAICGWLGGGHRMRRGNRRLPLVEWLDAQNYSTETSRR